MNQYYAGWGRRTLLPSEALSDMIRLASLVCVLLAVVGCGGGSGSGESGTVNTPTSSGASGVTDFVFAVEDVTGAPIVGAAISVTADGTTKEATTDAQGAATVGRVSRGSYSVLVTAAGFEPVNYSSDSTPGDQRSGITLRAEGAWAIGQVFVLGARVTERAADGSAMAFTLEIAVVDATFQPIEILTANQFRLLQIECGWGVCASDAERRATGSDGNYSVDGGAQDFGLQPSGARRPYVVGVLADRSQAGPDWTVAAPPLKSFFGALEGNDAASLMSVQQEGASVTFRSFGPFTNDGAAFFDAIDELAPSVLTPSVEDPPGMADAVAEAIRQTAAANPFDIPDVERHVLVVSDWGLSASEVHVAAELAASVGVRVSNIGGNWAGLYGLSELAARTQGVITGLDDWRQFELVFGALDSVLAGTLPFYRMQFKLTGAEGTFVSGGNVKLYLVVDVPSPLPNRGVLTETDIAIP